MGLNLVICGTNQRKNESSSSYIVELRLVLVLAPKSQPVLCSYKSAIFANVLTSYQHDLNFFQLSVLTFWARNWQWHHSPSDPKRNHLRVGFVYHNSPSRAHLLAIKTKLLGSSVSSLLEAEKRVEEESTEYLATTKRDSFHSYIFYFAPFMSVACVNVYDILSHKTGDNFWTFHWSRHFIFMTYNAIKNCK